MVRLTDHPDMTLDVYRGRKTTIQQFVGPCPRAILFVGLCHMVSYTPTGDFCVTCWVGLKRLIMCYRKNSKIWDTSNNCHNCPRIGKV